MLSEKERKKLVQENRVYLEALEEFDRTGQLNKVNVKERVTFTIDMNLMRKFRSYCESNNLKMSQVVEKLLKDKLKF
jgi:hypothetical protein